MLEKVLLDVEKNISEVEKNISEAKKNFLEFSNIFFFLLKYMWKDFLEFFFNF